MQMCEMSLQSDLFAVEERALVPTDNAESLDSEGWTGVAIRNVCPDSLSKQLFVTSCVEEVTG